MFEELQFGVTKKVDLHGLSKEEARAVLCHEIFVLDTEYSGLMVVHGYHSGKILKDFVRKEFEHKQIQEKVFVNAAVTFLKIKQK